MTNLEKLAIKQGLQIEALDYLVNNIDLERVIDNLDYAITKYGANPTLESHKKCLVESWERVYHPSKWEQ